MSKPDWLIYALLQLRKPATYLWSSAIQIWSPGDSSVMTVPSGAGGPEQLASVVSRVVSRTAHLGDFRVIEFRRYSIRNGQRPRFVRYFDTFFPEAFEQESVLILGSFRDRSNPDGFVWIRGFLDNFERGRANSAFYYGPVWREHRERMLALLEKTDNVLVLTPPSDDRGVPVLAAVDPVDEADTPRGFLLAQVLAVHPGEAAAFIQRCEHEFVRYRSVGVREVGILATFEGANTFPQHTVRADGPHIVWLGLAKDDTEAGRLRLTMQEMGQRLLDQGDLREPAEILELEPTPRSRLRWIESDSAVT